MFSQKVCADTGFDLAVNEIPIVILLALQSHQMSESSGVHGKHRVLARNNVWLCTGSASGVVISNLFYFLKTFNDNLKLS